MNDSEVKATLIALGAAGIGTHVRAQLEALIAKIPLAGTNLAAVMKHHRDHKRLEKILSVLNHLHDKTQGQEEGLKERLTEDQANELIHETLNAAALASDEEKLRMLKHGLANSFTSESLDFGCKQMYLQITRELTVYEVLLLSAVYSHDPHETTISLPQKELPSGIVATASYPLFMTTFETYYKRDASARTLGDYLTRRMKKWEKGLLKGVAGRLDGKGLTNLGPNLESNDAIRVREEKEREPLNGLVVTATIARIHQSQHITAQSSTPTARSRTDLGEEFLRFVRSS